MRVIPVRLGARSYRVRIVRQGLEGLPALLEERWRRIAMITDTTVLGLWAESLARSIAATGRDVRLHTLPGGEQGKSLQSLAAIWRFLLDNGYDRRQTLVLAVGGGVVGDVAAFAASTWMRGVDLVQAPTTLLAQVDSSVGGKTAINLDGAKNMVGTFHQPRLVYAGLKTLSTLPERELECGLAEVIKHGVIARPAILEHIRTQHAELRRREARALEPLVADCCQVKRDVVQADERERGLRRVLNFGHTFGHAIEGMTGHRKAHGEAVALGMVSAARVSQSLGLCGPEVREEIEDVLRVVGLDSDDRPYWRTEAVERIRLDKKRVGDSVAFVCVRSVGDVTVVPIAIGELKRIVRS